MRCGCTLAALNRCFLLYVCVLSQQTGRMIPHPVFFIFWGDVFSMTHPSWGVFGSVNGIIYTGGDCLLCRVDKGAVSCMLERKSQLGVGG